MGVLTSLISFALCALVYVRMIRRETPETLTKKQAVTPVAVGLLGPILSTALVLLIGLGVKTASGGVGLSGMIKNPVLSSLLSSFLLAGCTEELVKLLLFLAIVRLLRPKNVYEYALLLAGVGFGFTALEELTYGSGGGVAVSLFRLPCFAMHMVFGLIMGLELGLARHCRLQGTPGAGRHICLALVLPILWHTVYDASTVANKALLSSDEKLVVIGVAVALVAVLASAALQFAVLIHFRKNAEKYSAMESC